jgi:hypothetical protein
MKTRRLGQLDVSAIGLGCMSMTPIYGEPSEPEAIATVHRAVELGVTLIDTSDATRSVPTRSWSAAPSRASATRSSSPQSSATSACPTARRT